MEIYSKRKKIIKNLKYLSIASSIFTFTIVVSNTDNASAGVLSRLWNNFKNNASKLTLSSGKPFSLSKFADKHSNGPNWKKPFRRIGKFLKRETSVPNNPYSDVLPDGTIVTALEPGGDPYISPRRRRLGSISSVGSDDGFVPSIFKPPGPQNPYVGDFFTSDGGFGKVKLLKTTGKGKGTYVDQKQNFAGQFGKNFDQVSGWDSIYTSTDAPSTFDPTKRAKIRTTVRDEVRKILDLPNKQ